MVFSDAAGLALIKGGGVLIVEGEPYHYLLRLSFATSAKTSTSREPWVDAFAQRIWGLGNSSATMPNSTPTKSATALNGGI